MYEVVVTIFCDFQLCEHNSLINHPSQSEIKYHLYDILSFPIYWNLCQGNYSSQSTYSHTILVLLQLFYSTFWYLGKKRWELFIILLFHILILLRHSFFLTLNTFIKFQKSLEILNKIALSLYMINRNTSPLHCLCLALYPSILLCNFTHMDLVIFLLKILEFFVIPVTDILLPFPF